MVVLLVTLYGAYIFVNTKDYTKEMKALELQLAENKKASEQKQKEYEEKLALEKEKFDKKLKEVEDNTEKLKDIIKNIPIVGVGDSVMLGAVPNLYEMFPNGYFDADISRTAWVANGILKNIKKQNLLGDIVVLNMGTNGDCPQECKKDIMDTLKEKTVFWINTVN